MRKTLPKHWNEKIQRILRTLKSKITDQECKHLYLTGSQPEKFYGTAKMHKLPVNRNVNHLPVPVERACIVCSTNELLQTELKYIVKVFHETNNNPHYIIKQIQKQGRDEQNQQNDNV